MSEMSNNRLTLYSIVWNEIQELDTQYDQKVCDADDGEDDTVKEAKAEVLESLQETINNLVELKLEIENASMKNLKEKYI